VGAGECVIREEEDGTKGRGGWKYLERILRHGAVFLEQLLLTLLSWDLEERDSPDRLGCGRHLGI